MQVVHDASLRCEMRHMHPGVAFLGLQVDSDCDMIDLMGDMITHVAFFWGHMLTFVSDLHIEKNNQILTTK
jgi:hypothetical protein